MIDTVVVILDAFSVMTSETSDYERVRFYCLNHFELIGYLSQFPI